MTTRYATIPATLRGLRLLRFGDFQRSGGAWRFGVAVIGDGVIEQLIADGHAIRTGDTLRPKGGRD